MKPTLLSIAFLLSLSILGCVSDSVGEWQILTNLNYSSEIQQHPHILLIVTVPWCGESRSLMKELAHLVTARQGEFDSLKLMVMYKNEEKSLADAIGATDKITILYHHHSKSYKYRGKIRAQSILFSVHPHLSASPNELSIQHLKSHDELKTFLESTDKALLLLEFCGWTPMLLTELKNNRTETGFGVVGGLPRTRFNREIDRISMPRRKDDLKEAKHGNLMCSIDNGLNGIPWFGEFGLVNNNALSQETNDVNPGLDLVCTSTEFQQFDSFFSEFIKVAREFFLPSERHRFGLVTERSLLSSVVIGESGPWLAVLHLAGCPSCSKILKNEDDIKSILQVDNPIVTELSGDGQDLEPPLPANEPSVILFVDRSHDTQATKIMSKKALDSFRRLVASHQITNQTDWQNSMQQGKSSYQAYQKLRRTSGDSRLKQFPVDQHVGVKDKMSIMIINDDKHVPLDNVASDLQGSSLQETLTHLLQRKKETKLSSLAKDLGFRLLSNDLDIKVLDMLPSQEGQFSRVSLSSSEDGDATSFSNLNRDHIQNRASISITEHDTEAKLIEAEPYSHNDEKKKISETTIKQLISIEADQNSFLQTQSDMGEGDPLHGFKGSFFFSDSNYGLLRSLTGGSKVPSLVIIDPPSQQHYVFAGVNLSYLSVAKFLAEYQNGSLLPYERSDANIQTPREATHPPFVNLNFREVNSIPQITTNTFYKLVLGINQSDCEHGSHSHNEDILVLFSNSWCGFCQRMELVVREVHRAIKDYMKMLKTDNMNSEMVVNVDNYMNSIREKPPLIYLMECTLNDCSLILKSLNQSEVYPALVLFPAKGKEVVPYKGDVSVADVIKFIALHGSTSSVLLSERGILRTTSVKVDKRQSIYDSSSTAEAAEKDKLLEILLSDRQREAVVKHNTAERHHPDTDSHVRVGSILIATDKLIGAQPFDKSMVIIVKADRDSGFQGLIVNKQISWDTFHELEQGLDFLKKAFLYFGGPIIQREMPLVALTRGDISDQHPQVRPGIYFLDQLATNYGIEEIKSGDKSITNYWFFLGYSNWSWNQLFDEIDEGAWTISRDNTELNWP